MIAGELRLLEPRQTSIIFPCEKTDRFIEDTRLYRPLVATETSGELCYFTLLIVLVIKKHSRCLLFTFLLFCHTARGRMKLTVAVSFGPPACD